MVYKAVDTLCPFERDKWPVQGLGGLKCLVEAAAFVGQQAGLDGDAGLAEHFYAPA